MKNFAEPLTTQTQIAFFADPCSVNGWFPPPPPIQFLPPTDGIASVAVLDNTTTATNANAVPVDNTSTQALTVPPTLMSNFNMPKFDNQTIVNAALIGLGILVIGKLLSE